MITKEVKMEALFQLKDNHQEAYVDLPNELFQQLSQAIEEKTNKKDIRPLAFSFGYVTLVSFLYKYAHYFYYVTKNEEHPTGLQVVTQNDLKVMLGYSTTTNTVNFLTKKRGLLDKLGITQTTSNIPIYVLKHTYPTEEIAYQFYGLDNEELYQEGYRAYFDTVQRRSYEIKKPLFFFERNHGTITKGTLESNKQTVRVTIEELLYFLTNERLDLIDFLLYVFLKGKAKGIIDQGFLVSLPKVKKELTISYDTFHQSIKKLHEEKLILSALLLPNDVMESINGDVYYFHGVPTNELI